MPRATPFRLNRTGLLLALVSTAFAGQAQAAAGRVEFAIGPATVVGADGRTRPAGRGTELDTGDVVRTHDGRVQMRMTDGAFISLQPNTEFGIKDYKFQGRTDGSENAFYSLLKGAMRTVTGLIGRVNRNKYQVATPTATVGIRGTGGLIQVLNDGSTLVQGTSGIWFLANPAGSIDIPAGVSGLAPVDPKQPPKETVQIPTAGPSPLPALEGYVQGEQRQSDGSSVITGGGLVSGNGFAAAIAFGVVTGNGLVAMVDAGSGSAVFDGSGQMTQAQLSARGVSVYELQSGTHADFGTDGTLAWGRWISQVAVPGGISPTTTYTSNQGMHYVIGMPTPSMPTTGTATYVLLGATQPTYLVDSGAGPGVLTGTLSVSYGGASPAVGMNLNVAMPDRAYGIGGSASISGNTFSGFEDIFNSGNLTISGCSSGCNALINGFFAGAAAERAGLAYHIKDVAINKDVVGAAAFTKQ